MALTAEQADHINVVQWFGWNHPDLIDDLHHFANERKCSPQQGRILKRMGVKKGVADFFLAVPRNGQSGLWIELKVGNNKLTKEQEEFLHRKKSNGYAAFAARGWEEAASIISGYLKD